MIKRAKSKCDTCVIKGYSPEFCKAHHRQMTRSRNGSGNGNGADCPHHVSPAWGKGETAAVGAGLGAVLALGGAAMVPAVALKSFLGTYLLLKAGTAGGVVGAGAGLMGKGGEEPPEPQLTGKRRYHLFSRGKPH